MGHTIAFRPLIAALSAAILPLSCLGGAKSDFINPPLKFRARPLWFWNNTAVTAADVEAQLQGNRDRSGYGGLAPLPFGEKFTPKYLSEDYFRLYGAAVNGGSLSWDVPEGFWRIMTFVCVLDGDPNVDCFEPRQVAKYVGLVYQPYDDRVAKDFGSTLAGAFYEEPTMCQVEGRVWTDRFTERFEAACGFSPTPYYPALGYDIGP
jgi:hypothetical protein